MTDFFGITRLSAGKTRLFTAENVYGEKGRGGMAELSAQPQPEVERIGQVWEGPSAGARELGRGYKVRPCITLPAGRETVVADADGPGRLTDLWFTQQEKALRDVILRIYWDGERQPSVEAPMGDFFCCGWSKYLRITSLMINVNPTGGMHCFFPMPFRTHVRVTVENRLPADLSGFFYAVSMEEGPVGADEAYFHARFRRVNPVPYGSDYVLLDGVEGHGHYVGTQLCWQQNNDGWWGEGEVKAFIDGDDAFPSYCGTGTEDYFGGAWCFNGNFSAPFFGYQDLSTLGEHPRVTNTPGNRHSMYRFHIPDPIRFGRSLRVTIQCLGWRSEGRYLPLQDDLASVAYWYQAEPHRAFPPLGGRNALEVV